MIDPLSLERGYFFSLFGIIEIEVFDVLPNHHKNEVKAKKSAISSGIMDQIISILSSTYHGNVTLIYQDSRLVQIERNEKIRPSELNGENHQLSQGLKGNYDIPAVRARILESFDKLQYGQVVIVIKEGRIIQIDRTEKQRFPTLDGVYGDGI